MSSAIPTSRNCCCITATISRVFSSVEVFMVMWKRTPFTAGYPAASSNWLAFAGIVVIGRHVAVVRPTCGGKTLRAACACPRHR